MRPAWIHNTRILYLLICLGLYTQAISIQVERTVLTAPAQGSALLSVDVTCTGTPTIRWKLTSAQRQLTVAAWTLGGDANITQTYAGRVQTHPNGSLTISELCLRDSGYYILTVTETTGNSRDTGLLLSVTEVLSEDLQFLTVFAAVLGTLAALLMLCMWLLNKLHHFITAWRKSTCLPEHNETELQPL